MTKSDVMSHWDLDTTRTRPDVTKTHPNAVIGPIPAELGMVISMCSGCARSFVERERCDRSDTNVVFLLATAVFRQGGCACLCLRKGGRSTGCEHIGVNTSFHTALEPKHLVR